MKPLAAFLLLAAPLFAETLDGKVVAVYDGDTITVLENGKQHKIRLLDIDAPESRQPFGTKAKQALSDKVFGKTVRIEWKEKDRYGRTLGKVLLGERWINREMIEDGLAWHYKQYSTDAELGEAEDNAPAAKAGLWKENAVAPWDYRKSDRRKKTAARYWTFSPY